MSTIVRKRAFTTLGTYAMAHPYAKRARMAYTAGRFVYDNRKNIAKAARTIGRAYRKYRKRVRSRIGERVGKQNCKRDITNNVAIQVTKTTRTLYNTELTSLPAGTSENQRERQIANIRGFKICLELRNATTTPMWFNLAIISDKVDPRNTPGTTDFFRAYGADRTQDFATTLSSNEFHCLPINTDRYYVLKHKRMCLGATTLESASYIENKRNNYMALNLWVPLKRQLRFPLGSGTPHQAIYMVYWFDKVLTDAGTAGTINAVNWMERVIIYFKDTKN